MLAVAIGVGAALLVVTLRPDGDGVDPAGHPAAPAAPVAVPELAASYRPPGAGPDHRTPGTGPATTDEAPVPPHDSGGVTAVEELDPAGAAAAARVAEAFAAAWSAPGPDWLGRMAAYATPSLVAALAGATPVDPAPERLEAGSLLHATPAWARVRVPSERGDLVLDLTLTGSRWLVSAVDWRPA
jgi:hypothetical protein